MTTSTLAPAAPTDTTNPLIAEFHEARAEYGDTAEQWVDAISPYIDGETSSGELADVVHNILGIPNTFGDVEAWAERVHNWCTEAIDYLTKLDS